MNCPICKRFIPPIGWCSHSVGPYWVKYDHDLDSGVATLIWLNRSDLAWENPILVLKGFVELDEERIEKLLVLR